MKIVVNLLELREVQIVLYVSIFEEVPQAKSFVYLTRKMMLEPLFGFPTETVVVRVLHVDYGLDYEDRRLDNESSRGRSPSPDRFVADAKVLAR